MFHVYSFHFPFSLLQICYYFTNTGLSYSYFLLQICYTFFLFYCAFLFLIRFVTVFLTQY